MNFTENHDLNTIAIDPSAIESALRSRSQVWDAAEMGITAAEAQRRIAAATSPEARAEVIADLRRRAIARAKLDTTNGRVNMFAVKTPPWHRLGVLVDQAPTIAEAIRLAGADWSVELRPLYRLESANAQYFTNSNNSTPLTTSDGAPYRSTLVAANAVIRTDTGATLADAVGPKYTPLQNVDAFNWFDPFLQSGQAKLETAGSLAGGKKVWILAELQRDPITVRPGDEVRKYILLTNSHDGTQAVRTGFCPVRVVCQNTLSQAVSTNGNLLRMRHTKSLAETMTAAREVIQRVDAEYAQIGAQYRQLAARPIKSAAQLREWIVQTFDLTPNAKKPEELCTRSQATLDSILKRMEDCSAIGAELAATHRERTEIHHQAAASANAGLLDSILSNFETGTGANDAAPADRRSWWDAYNAVTEYLTHERGKDASRRLDSLWTGESARISADALRSALQLSA